MLYFWACPRRLPYSEDIRAIISLFLKAVTEILFITRKSITEITPETKELESLVINLNLPANLPGLRWCNERCETATPALRNAEHRLREKKEKEKKNITNFPQTIFFLFSCRSSCQRKAYWVGGTHHRSNTAKFSPQDRNSIRNSTSTSFRASTIYSQPQESNTTMILLLSMEWQEGVRGEGQYQQDAFLLPHSLKYAFLQKVI